MLLEIRELTKYFGGLAALYQFNMHVREGEIVGLIGPNGAGKTTIFNLITGVLRPTKGQVVFDAQNITGRKPHVIAELGIGRTFQLNPLFANFTTLQNVVASFHLRPRSSLLDAYFNTATYRRNEAYILDQSMEILQLVGLDKVKDELAKNLPHGYQKMLGVARALATKPRLLLMDEPIAGMNPSEIDFTMTNIRKIQQKGMTIVLIEHNMQVLDLCDRAVVINYGHKIAEGSPEEVRKNKEVARAYFGSEIERFDNGTSRACSNACPAPAPYHHDALLSVKNIVVHYGKSMALDNVSIEVAKGKVVTILGANGAGKTTILKALSGLKSLTSGEIWFLNNRIDGRETNEIVKLGIVHIPEGRKLFPYLNVLTNLKLGASLRKDKAGINQDMDEIFERFPILWERRNQQAGSLSGGEQQMLAIARGLMAKPKLLLMDEPSLGLAPTVIDELARVIKDINQGGVSVLLVEQNISLALRVANRGYALQVGRVVLEGDINDFRDTESVSKAYLGK